MTIKRKVFVNRQIPDLKAILEEYKRKSPFGRYIKTTQKAE